VKLRYLVLGLIAVATIEGCSDCSDCHRGPIPVAYVTVRTTTSAGGLPGVAVHLERPGFVPLIAVTDSLGRHTFEALDAVDGEQVTLIVAPPPAYAEPEPRALALALNDTLDVEVVLDPED
jgi:hypothetical protein